MFFSDSFLQGTGVSCQRLTGACACKLAVVLRCADFAIGTPQTKGLQQVPQPLSLASFACAAAFYRHKKHAVNRSEMEGVRL